MNNSPNPTWRPGQPVESPVREWVELDPAAMSQRDRYKILIGTVIPRPIAFISTVSAEGAGNLAPFSFFNGVSSDPTCVIVSISGKSDGSGEKKDTLRNIEATGEFVVNTVSEWLVEPMVHCAAAYPYGVDEMSKAGLTPIPSLKVRPPRVRESPVHFECKLHQLVAIGDGGAGSTTLVIGEVVYFHVYDEAYEKGRINAAKLRPAARLGGFGYALLGETFEVKVPEV